MNDNVQRWAGLGLGAALLLGFSIAISYRALAGAPGDKKPPAAQIEERPAAQDPAQPQPPGGFPGNPGFPGFRPGQGNPGFAGNPGFPGMMGMMGGGPAQMTATATNVYILRGNTLYSFDARTLRFQQKAELPMPEMQPGAFPPGAGGFGGGGNGGQRPGGRGQ